MTSKFQHMQTRVLGMGKNRLTVASPERPGTGVMIYLSKHFKLWHGIQFQKAPISCLSWWIRTASLQSLRTLLKQRGGKCVLSVELCLLENGSLSAAKEKSLNDKVVCAFELIAWTAAPFTMGPDISMSDNPFQIAYFCALRSLSFTKLTLLEVFDCKNRIVGQAVIQRYVDQRVMRSDRAAQATNQSSSTKAHYYCRIATQNLTRKLWMGVKYEGYHGTAVQLMPIPPNLIRIRGHSCLR